jgi:hypothetical protein
MVVISWLVGWLVWFGWLGKGGVIGPLLTTTTTINNTTTPQQSIVKTQSE